jgi:hypothetical protein
MKNSSNKSFGILFFIVFLIIGLWPLYHSNPIRLWSVIVAVIFLILGLSNSRILSPFNKAWIKLGELLGKIIAPVVMFIVFFVVLTPLSLIVRIFKKDLLKLKYSKEKSYWIKREENIGSMKKQF